MPNEKQELPSGNHNFVQEPAHKIEAPRQVVPAEKKAISPVRQRKEKKIINLIDEL